MNRNITSANSTATLIVKELYPAGITLQQFSTDQAYSIEQKTVAETHMGVDGYLTAGYTPTENVINFTFEPSSPSLASLVAVYAAQVKNKRLYECAITISQPSLGRTIAYSVGVMRGGNFVADARKVHSPVSFSFSFESMTITNTGEGTNWTTASTSQQIVTAVATTLATAVSS